MVQRFVQVKPVTHFVVLLALLVLQACGSLPQREDSAPVAGRSVGTGSTSPAAIQTSKVIQDLIQQADEQRQAGQLDEAARIMERAIRIEPASALVWNNMANIRFLQGDYAQAAVLASRSNTLAGQDEALRQQNLTLMMQSYETMGELERVRRIREQMQDSAPAQ